jgi:hypothetical protein
VTDCSNTLEDPWEAVCWGSPRYPDAHEDFYAVLDAESENGPLPIAIFADKADAEHFLDYEWIRAAKDERSEMCLCICVMRFLEGEWRIWNSIDPPPEPTT